MATLNEYLESQEQTEKESFVIDDDNRANWALRKIKQYKDEQAQNNALATAEIDKIESWNKEENQKAQDSIDFFQGLLAVYAMNKREADPKFKSQKLPNGSIKFRKQQPNFIYDDRDLIDSLKKSDRSDLINVKESPDKKEIKKAFKVEDDKLVDPETGEVIGGVTVEHRDDKFEVKTDE